ncbi:MAG TPA: carbohydrate binding family 9 domain-containing protein, partial [Thermoanaerobaculia bacterium]
MKVKSHRGPAAFWLGLLLLSALPSLAATQEKPAPPQPAPELRQFEVRRSATPIKVDGVLDEDAWKTATVVDLPYEWFPGDNTTPPVKTEALITYDGDNLYVAFRCQDPDPKAIRSHLMDRDAINTFVQDDHVGFSVDTFNDERHAFQFRVNPRGVQVDGTFSEANGAEDFSWDAIWNAAGRITADGWEAEIAIPLRQLRFPRTAGAQTWGFDLFRSYPRSVRHRITSRYTDRAKDCILCQENKVSGFQGMAPGRNLEL